ncbi:MAG: hypothetical protein Q9191_000924 [Dirinaria sp. TL-2023a]
MADSHDAFDGVQMLDQVQYWTWTFRETLLIPYLTVENLSKDGARLLRLLFYRSFHLPEEWVSFDNRQLLEGWRTGMFDEKFNGGRITMHGESYGTWNPFDKAAVHNGDCYTAPRALLILDAQATLEPFCRPPVFDDRTIDQLLEIVCQKQEEAKDSMWLLQTDPAYFYEFATHWNEYNYNALPGAKATKDAKIHALGGRLVIYSVTQVQDWESLEDELRHVRAEFETHREAISVGQGLPKTYDQALGYLETLVHGVLIHKSIHLKELCHVSPAWKSWWTVEEQFGADKFILAPKPDIVGTEDLLLLRLGALCTIGERPKSAE